jgi:hypothetical protein
MAEDMEAIKKGMAEARQRKMKNRSLIDSAFPASSNPQPAYQGSQSMSPGKSDNYTDTLTGIPSIDRYGYQP